MVEFSEFEEEVNTEFDRLIEVGAVIFTGEFENGEPVYTFDPEVMKRERPELWHKHLDEVDQSMLDLQSKGMVEIDLSEPEPRYSLTEYGQNVIDAINMT